MSATTIDNIVVLFKKEYGVDLTIIPPKEIIYDGKTKTGKCIVIIMPTSRIYARCNGWIDLTKIQIDILKQYQIAVQFSGYLMKQHIL